MPALATILPYVLKALPVVVVLLVVGYLVVRYKVNQRKILEDTMRKQKEQDENEVSQLSSVQKVEQDMAQATTNRPTNDQTAERMENGTY